MTASSLAASSDLFRHEDDSGVVTLTLNTPRSLNALSLAMLEALIAEFEAIASDDQARVIVLAGVGPALSAGHDLKEMQLVAACDLAVAGEKARFGLSGVNFGLFCSTPLVAVGRAIPRKRAMEMAMTGQLYSAADAEHFGLVNRVVPEGHAVEEAQALAKTIAQQSGPTLAIGKRAFYEQIEQPLDQAYSVASLAMIDNLAEPDCIEGMSAFLEKRRPRWGIDTGE